LSKKSDGGIEYNPAKKPGILPVPESKKPSSRRVVFSRTKEEIRTVSIMLFDREDEKPGIVGDRCFELVLTKSPLGEGDPK
jgi:hypothetical protein